MSVKQDETDFFYGKESDQFTFYRIPKLLFSDSRYSGMSTDAKLLYGLLLDRMSLSAKNGWVDSKNRVYIIYTVEELAEPLKCGVRKVIQMMNELENEYALILRVRQGLCKPNLIYVKSFMTDCKDLHVQKCRKCTSGSAENDTSGIAENDMSGSAENDMSGPAENACPEVQILHTNNTDINNTEYSDIHPIVSVDGIEDRMDGNALYSSYRDYFMEHAGIKELILDMPEDKVTILGILNLLSDTCSSKKKEICIAGDDKPIEIVRGKLMKLEIGHLRYVISCMKENRTKIRNIRKYLLAALYNAPDTMESYYRAKVNNDIAEGRI